MVMVILRFPCSTTIEFFRSIIGTHLSILASKLKVLRQYLCLFVIIIFYTNIHMVSSKVSLSLPMFLELVLDLSANFLGKYNGLVLNLIDTIYLQKLRANLE